MAVVVVFHKAYTLVYLEKIRSLETVLKRMAEKNPHRNLVIPPELTRTAIKIISQLRGDHKIVSRVLEVHTNSCYSCLFFPHTSLTFSSFRQLSKNLISFWWTEGWIRLGRPKFQYGNSLQSFMLILQVFLMQNILVAHIHFAYSLTEHSRTFLRI